MCNTGFLKSFLAVAASDLALRQGAPSRVAEST